MLLPAVRLTVNAGRSATYDVSPEGFLIGSVPGCDLRLTGTDLPPVICLIARTPDGPSLRKLALTQLIAVNGKPSLGGLLANGDSLTLGSIELRIAVSEIGRPAKTPKTPPQGNLSERQRRLEKEVHELEAQRAEWGQRRADMVHEQQALQQRKQELANARAEVNGKIQELSAGRTDLERQRHAVSADAEQLKRKQYEVELVRHELTELRRQLYEQYRERRDRLTALQEAITKAARKVQEHKRAVQAEAATSVVRQREDEERRKELDGHLAELERERESLIQKEQQLDTRAESCLADEQRLEKEREALTSALEEKRATLERQEQQYQADVVRLLRMQTDLEQREQQFQAQLKQVEERSRQLDRERREQEEQAQQLEEWHQKLCAEADQLARQKAEQQTLGIRLVERESTLEKQQQALAALRSRLEQDRESLIREEQQLVSRRGRLAEMEADQERTQLELQARRAALEADLKRLEEDSKSAGVRAAQFAEVTAKLRQTQEGLIGEEQRLKQQAEAQKQTGSAQTEQAQMLHAKSQQLLDMQERLTAERQALREREAALMQAEQVRIALQEQLRRRADELAERQKDVAERTRLREEERAALETRIAEIERERQENETRLTSLIHENEERAQVLEQARTELAAHESDSNATLQEREAELARHQERLKESGRAVAAVRKKLAEQRLRWDKQRVSTETATLEARAELEAMRATLGGLQKSLPELQLGARTAAERLDSARTQLTSHLEEVHTFARQRQEDLEGLRAQVREEAERVRQQALALQRSRDEQRLAVAAFRQQIITWQGQIGELRRSLAQDETRIEMKQAEIQQAAQAVDDTTLRLVEQAEQLHDQEREVAVRRDEFDRHLTDMREWYRRKLRELVMGHDVDTAPTPQDESASPEGRDILALTGNVDPADRRLGDLLQSLELVDADILSALLIEARRQRRSLRQVLLASGHVTLYQLALIEAGNVDALVLGPVRVIDRLKVAPYEAIYRVFDPRRVAEGIAHALLRHLSEEAMQDAVKPDEFRQRFGSVARLQHPNVAATYEVLEIANRPAALQEWVVGLSGAELTDLASVPGICYRLLCQATLGLMTAHQAGHIHGRINASTLVLTREGVLKICGLGEPSWLTTGEAAKSAEPKVEDDLLALGLVAAAWLAPHLSGKSSKAKQAAKPLLKVVERLGAETPEARYPSAAALMEDLEKIGAQVSPNAEAWDRLLRIAREHTADDTALRQSA
jgi:chromosome segregation ATPase